MIPAIGIDIGRVIISSTSGRGDTSFLDGDLAAALKTPPNRNAFPAIRELVALFAGRVWLVSKAGPRVQDRTRRWLDHHAFWASTGVQREQLIFCRLREEKARIARELGLGFFVDDRRDVLDAMLDVVPHRFLFGPQRDPAPRHAHVPDWPASIIAIRAALTRETSGNGPAPSR